MQKNHSTRGTWKHRLFVLLGIVALTGVIHSVELVSNTHFTIGNKEILFQKEVTFHDTGEVQMGYLAEQTTIDGIKYDRAFIELYRSGKVYRGVLAEDTAIDGKTYAKSMIVQFDAEGRLVESAPYTSPIDKTIEELSEPNPDEEWIDNMVVFLPIFFVGFSIFIVIISVVISGKIAEKQRRQLEETAINLGLQFIDTSDDPNSFGNVTVLGSKMNSSFNPTMNTGQNYGNIPNTGQNYSNDPSRGYNTGQNNQMAIAFKKMFFSGCTFWKLKGKYNQVDVEVTFEVRSSGKSSTTYTILNAYFSENLGLGLRIYREGFFSKIGKAVLKSQDIQIGNPEFDSKVMIKGVNEPKIMSLLQNMNTQQAILELLQKFPYAQIEDNGVRIEHMGKVITSEVEYRDYLDRMSAVIKTFMK